MIGKTISHYKILEKLGEGGMGVVYKAHDTKLDRTVALKFLPSHLTKSDEDKGRFIREAKAAAALNHPNICTIHSVDEHDGTQFIVMEYIDGVTLREKIGLSPLDKGGPQGGLSIDTALSFALQIAEALAEAHEKGIVHRDIKPENIMVDAKNRIKVMDFGLAKLKGEMNLTKAGSTVGTVAYMSPEQIQGQDVDHRSDIFSFGVMLYELLTGNTPFRGEHEAAMVYSIVNEDPFAINQDVPDVSPGMIHLLDRLLEKDPHDRYQLMSDVVSELRRLKKKTSQKSISTGQMTSNVMSGVQAKSKKRIALPVLVIFALFILVGLGFLIFYERSGDGPPVSSDRIAVMVFENLTGDPPLDPIGRMTSDWLTQGLSQTGLIEIVPSSSIFAVTAGMEADGITIAGPSGVRAVAGETGASLVISGTYYKVGTDIQFQAQVTDVPSDRLLLALDPISGPLDTITETIEYLRQRTLGSLAAHFDERLSRFAEQTNLPVTYDAYRYYIEGVERFHNQDFTGAIAVLQRSTNLSPDFIIAYMYKAYSYMNSNQFEAADSIINTVQKRRDELSPLDRTMLDYMVATLKGDRTRALHLARTAYSYAPNSEIVWLYVPSCIYNNRPREAIELLESIDPESHILRGGWRRGYYLWLFTAYNLAGEHDKGLALMREGRREFPDDLRILSLEMRALIASGEIDEIDTLLDEARAMLPADNVNPGWVMILTGLELLNHGYTDIAKNVFQDAVEWFRRHPGESEGNHAIALYYAGYEEESKRKLEDILRVQPDNVVINGFIGIAAANMGALDRARDSMDTLANIDDDYLYGRNTMWRAWIAIQLGEHRKGISLMHEAYREGYLWVNDFEFFQHLMEPVFDDPEYQELVALRN
jgi:serine/threonine protein kinase/tetratricopeptide (TPR) repeat protein